jgi:tetratricopeptide (TPR) repeat protein
MGEHAKAVETLSQALTKRQDYASAYANLGTAYYALNKLDEATKAWDKALSLDPTNEKLKKKLQKIRGM